MTASQEVVTASQEVVTGSWNRSGGSSVGTGRNLEKQNVFCLQDNFEILLAVGDQEKKDQFPGHLHDVGQEDVIKHRLENS